MILVLDRKKAILTLKSQNETVRLGESGLAAVLLLRTVKELLLLASVTDYLGLF